MAGQDPEEEAAGPTPYIKDGIKGTGGDRLQEPLPQLRLDRRRPEL